ncbi:MAG: HlyD family efflux transporter periplasmic adaptor subunit [Pirellulaceae bacterium]|nr:HlyD family efflux transporter periplasmic adaptor subunit [Pirellulaceae bacterium]
MKTVLLIGLTLAAAGVAAGWVYYRAEPTNEGQARAAAEGHSASGPPPADGPRAVHALGRLEPAGTVLKIAAPAGNEGNRLDSLLVKEGDQVQAGALLATLDTLARRVASVEQEEARLTTTLARLAQVKAGNKAGDIEAARAVVGSWEHEVENKARDRERCERLKQSNAISFAELDNARLAHERALATLQQSKAQLAAINEVRGVDIAVAEADVQLSRSSLALAKAHLAAAQILAPSSGTILRIHARPGEQIASSGLLEMGQIDRMQAVAEVFEGDVPRLALGDEALVTVDTTGHRVRGRVAEIGFLVARKTTLTNDPVSDTDARVVEVRIDLERTSWDWLSRLSNARVQVAISAASDGPSRTQPRGGPPIARSRDES